MGQDAILGMDFMVPAGIRFVRSDGTLCIPDEAEIRLAGRRPLYGLTMRTTTTNMWQFHQAKRQRSELELDRLSPNYGSDAIHFGYQL